MPTCSPAHLLILYLVSIVIFEASALTPFNLTSDNSLDHGIIIPLTQLEYQQATTAHSYSPSATSLHLNFRGVWKGAGINGVNTADKCKEYRFGLTSWLYECDDSDIDGCELTFEGYVKESIVCYREGTRRIRNKLGGSEDDEMEESYICSIGALLRTLLPLGLPRSNESVVGNTGAAIGLQLVDTLNLSLVMSELPTTLLYKRPMFWSFQTERQRYFNLFANFYCTNITGDSGIASLPSFCANASDFNPYPFIRLIDMVSDTECTDGPPSLHPESDPWNFQYMYIYSALIAVFTGILFLLLFKKRIRRACSRTHSQENYNEDTMEPDPAMGKSTRATGRFAKCASWTRCCFREKREYREMQQFGTNPVNVTTYEQSTVHFPVGNGDYG